MGNRTGSAFSGHWAVVRTVAVSALLLLATAGTAYGSTIVAATDCWNTDSANSWARLNLAPAFFTRGGDTSLAFLQNVPVQGAGPKCVGGVNNGLVCANDGQCPGGFCDGDCTCNQKDRLTWTGFHNEAVPTSQHAVRQRKLGANGGGEVIGTCVRRIGASEIPNCTGAGAPYSCCTGAGAGTCGNGNISGINANCTAVGTPYTCCTGLGTGTCSPTAAIPIEMLELNLVSVAPISVPMTGVGGNCTYTVRVRKNGTQPQGQMTFTATSADLLSGNLTLNQLPVGFRLEFTPTNGCSSPTPPTGSHTFVNTPGNFILAPPNPVPSMNVWGMIALLALLLIGMTYMLWRRKWTASAAS